VLPLKLEALTEPLGAVLLVMVGMFAVAKAVLPLNIPLAVVSENTAFIADVLAITAFIAVVLAATASIAVVLATTASIAVALAATAFILA